MDYIPDQGDLVWLDFDPSSGKEIMKRRPAFIISKKIFNERTRLAIVAPVTSTIKGMSLEVVLPKATKTNGAILVFQLKSIDLVRRNVEFIEKTSVKVIKQVSDIAQTIVQ
jgi:mRNA interferase MazF/mRNA interferase ChpB